MRGQNQKWPTSGTGGYVAAYGVTNASERGVKSELAHKWTAWLHIPYDMGAPQRFSAGDKFRRGPHVGRKAT